MRDLKARKGSKRKTRETKEEKITSSIQIKLI